MAVNSNPGRITLGAIFLKGLDLAGAAGKFPEMNWSGQVSLLGVLVVVATNAGGSCPG